MQLPEDFWNPPRQGRRILAAGRHHLLPHPPARCAREFVVNQFVVLRGQMPLYAPQVREVSGKTARAGRTLRDYTHGKNNVWGITARNREQNFALNLLMNPEPRLRLAAG